LKSNAQRESKSYCSEEYVSCKDKIFIKHARNGGEQIIAGVPVD
jgi:hypothetical protein